MTSGNCRTGTVGVKILNQFEGDPDAIFVPVGGGGLVAGIAAYVKYLKPQVKVIGVEASGSDCLNQALIAGQRGSITNRWNGSVCRWSFGGPGR
ncbi:MAG: hypothetical protein Ct9H300mP8_10100 [Gammaproteobacteria bacterium]|nr:MAG: hypothetical protein Ct9H300mP8_10100 [Gammaproteobacteria bacterium]